MGEPVTVEKFHAMHVKVAIAKSEVEARQQRAEEEAKRQRLDEIKQKIQGILNEAWEVLTAAENAVTEAEATSKPLTRDNADLLADEIKGMSEKAETLTSKAQESMEQATAKLKDATEQCAAEEDLKGYNKEDSTKITARLERTKARVAKVTDTVKKARDKAVQKEYQETDAKWSEAVVAIRSVMSAESKDADAMFESVNEGGAVSKDKFCAFLEGGTESGRIDLKLEKEQASKLFDHIVGEAKEITKERFRELVRLYYKCVKATVLNDEISIKSKTSRRVEIGEPLEAIEGPSKEDGANVKRVKCKCMVDNAEGWITIAGNQGTAFLEPWGKTYICVKETIITDGLQVAESKSIRRLGKDEVVEVLEFPQKDAGADVQRIKGKAKLDGTVGWITIASSTGSAFLELS